jgi:hypothetical protein
MRFVHDYKQTKDDAVLGAEKWMLAEITQRRFCCASR